MESSVVTFEYKYNYNDIEKIDIEFYEFYTKVKYTMLLQLNKPRTSVFSVFGLLGWEIGEHPELECTWVACVNLHSLKFVSSILRTLFLDIDSLESFGNNVLITFSLPCIENVI